MFNYFFLPLVLLANFWIWRIFDASFVLGLLSLLAALFLYLTLKNKYKPILFYLVFVVVLVFQMQTNDKVSLTDISSSDRIIQLRRLNEYPPVYLEVGGKNIYLPIALWMEQRKESVVFFSALKNLSHIVDPGLYFFANHPRQRVGYVEFEKFPYILLPFFVWGFLNTFTSKKNIHFLASFLIPAALFSLLGTKNSLDLFALFPFIAIGSTFGLEEGVKFLDKLPKSRRKILIVLFLLTYLLVFVQLIYYNKN